MEVHRHFTWEGFHKLDVISAINEMGYSKTEIKRLFKNNAIKIWDTRVTDDGCHFVWYKRIANIFELVKPGDVFIIGKYKELTIKTIPFNWFERVYYNLRHIKDIIQDEIEDFIGNWGLGKIRRR